MTADAGPGVSVAMVARDEADRIGRALDSVSWADEAVVVVDERTRDATGEVARSRGARVEWRSWQGMAEQKRRALELAAGPWVLLLDADEEVTPGLGREIRERVGERRAVAGYELPFLTRYLGRWLGRRGWYRERHLRLVRKERASVLRRPVHVGLAVDGPVARMEGFVLHRSYRDVAHHAEKIVDSARLKARWMAQEGRSASRPGAVARACAAVARELLLRGRVLEGVPGWVWAGMAGHYDLLAYLELWETGRGDGDAPPDAEAARPDGAEVRPEGTGDRPEGPPSPTGDP